MNNIPYNLTTQDFSDYGDGLNGTIKMPTPTSYNDVSEIGYSWGTTIGQIIGRAKGFGGIGTIGRDEGVYVLFPTTFLNLPIIKIKLIAPINYSHFDDVYISDPRTTNRSGIWGNSRIIPDFFDDRDSVWKGQRIVHDAWERRDSPLQMIVYTNQFYLAHIPNERNVPNIDPTGNLFPKFDARGETLTFVWHAFGV